MRALIIFITLFCTMMVVYAKQTLSINSAPVSVDQAFHLSGMSKDQQTLVFTWKIMPGYYLYKNRFSFRSVNNSDAKLGQPILPTAAMKIIPGLGKFAVYHDRVTIVVPVLSALKEKLPIQIQYQGCFEQGYCYPPMTKVILLNLAGPYEVFTTPLIVDLVAGEQSLSTQQNQITLQQTNNQSYLSNLLHDKNSLFILLAFFIFGVLISMTPCVLPMIPILSSIILGQSYLTRARSIGLSASYVVSMAATYAFAGMLFGVIGGQLQAVLQKPWMLIVLSLIFVAMALSLFGCYQIQLPTFIRHRSAVLCHRQKHGSYLGVACMGCLSILILSPCVTPPLVAVLSYVSQAGSMWFGGLTLFVMGLGMGAPLLLIGAVGANILPKAGHWMQVIKNFLGILMLVIALSLVSRMISATVMMWLWALLAVGVAIFMGAFSTADNLRHWVAKLGGLLLFIYGILLMVGSAQGNHNLLQPINWRADTSLCVKQNNQAQKAVNFIPVKNLEDIQKQMALRFGRPVLLDFYADWCLTCHEIEQRVFTNVEVQKKLRKFLLLRADVTANNAQDKQMQRYFNVVAPPTILFFDRQHQLIDNSRLIGEISAKQFLQQLQILQNNDNPNK